MSRLMLLTAFAVAFAVPDGAFATETSGTREFKAAAGGKLTLDLDSGGSVKVSGTGGSAVTISYKLSCSPDCEISFDQSGSDVRVRTKFKEPARSQNSDGEFDIRVPSRFDVALDSMGGRLEIDGVTGAFTGETKGGEITLHDVEGEAKLTTMGGEIRVTDSTLDGSVSTMGGPVTIENVSGDLKGSSMGGGVRYKNVRRSDGKLASPPNTGGGDPSDITRDTVQISTMGGDIDTEDAPDGADVMTMGGDITVKSAKRFVRAKTMGGDIEIDSVDGWVQATTMGGDLDVSVIGGGGDVSLTSMSGNVVLNVPRGFGMELDLEIAFTKNSRKEYTLTAPGAGSPSVSPDWDYDKGSPRKYIRKSGAVNGGGHKVTVRTINGNVTVRER
ncbi:MAG TPA: DUF4097 family beta strand repeat-containing protein [Candidatus Polarisedimenticolaceae bacterium]|nr:DUF4097 family beta strand repeat-containing protein [Candidatus Polarisedimenticolaceae bacterium]